MKTLQERMVEYRARNNITQTELARRCRVSLQTINSVENGLQNPSRVTLAKIEMEIGKEEEDG